MTRCFACISTTVFFTLAIASLFGQSPLDAPGEKKVTVRSEIARGDSELFKAALNRPGGWALAPVPTLVKTGLQDMSLGHLWRAMNDVIERNKSLQKDSEGFMLGARLQQVERLDDALHADGIGQFNTEKDIREYFSRAQECAKDVRALQKKLGIDDNALAEAQSTYNSAAAVASIRRLLSSYEYEPQPAPGNSTRGAAPVGLLQSPQVVKTTQSVSIGNVVLPVGTRVEFISKEGSDVHIRYRGGEYAIPISSTDLK